MTDNEFKNLLESEQVLFGKGVPPASLGKDLDLYIDKDSRLFYRKYFGAWNKAADVVLGPLFTVGNMSWDQLLVDASLSQLFEFRVDGSGNRMLALKPPPANGRLYTMTGKNGVASWHDMSTDFAAWLESQKNKPGGVPGLDEHGWVDPSKVFPPGYQKDVAGGIPGLDNEGNLKYDELPDGLIDDLNSRAKKDGSNLDDSLWEKWKKKLGISDEEFKDNNHIGRLIGGELIQWGLYPTKIHTDEHSSGQIVFPVAFQETPIVVTACAYFDGIPTSFRIVTQSTTSFTYSLDSKTHHEGAAYPAWIAIEGGGDKPNEA